MKETNETIKLKYKKKDKQRSIFYVKETNRYHHDTRYEGTRDVDVVLNRNRTFLIVNLYFSNNVQSFKG